jgi:hypothetical protein
MTNELKYTLMEMKEEKTAIKKMWCPSQSVTRQEIRSSLFQSTSDLRVDAGEEQKEKKSLQRKHNQGYTGRQI